MLRFISSHAVDQYIDRIDKTLNFGQARVAMFRVYQMSRSATEYEQKLLRRHRDGEVDYRLCDTCFGLLCMPVKRGVVVTIYAVTMP